MNVAVLGPQGSGKGTQGGLLAQYFKMAYLDMGEILRSVARQPENKYHNEVKRDLEVGNLVKDELVRLLAWDFINKNRGKGGVVFDGYPRSVAQYEHLQDMLRKFGEKVDGVIYLTISEAESIKRLSIRRICDRCGRIYKREGKCSCGGKLVQREDDKPEAIKRRLALYEERTRPVLERAKADGWLMEIDGEKKIEEIHREIVKKLT